MSDNKQQQTSETPFFVWYLKNLAKIILLFVSLVMFSKKAWVGEDAFIFFRYVDNFVSGNGMVFNIGERVEGFTSALWVFLLAFIRYFTHFELRPIAIYLGLLLSVCTIYLLIYHNAHKEDLFFPLAAILLMGNSAVRDFATSGFETALTYVLLVATLLVYQKYALTRNVSLLSCLVSLLVLNRPEAFLILLYLSALICIDFIKVHDFRKAVQFFLPPLFILGSYQIFRMGYFASLLPNTFYAKKGGEFYMPQGINYIVDFATSYPFTTFLLTVLIISHFYFKPVKTTSSHIIFMCTLLLFYVLYAGGDYMHGRSLLMAYITLCIGCEDACRKLIIYLADKSNSGRDVTQYFLFLLIPLLLLVNTMQVPITEAKGKQINNIASERSNFGYSEITTNFVEYAKNPITFEYGWAERGMYYKELSDVLNMPLTVYNANIGYFGYAAGKNISVVGCTLTDHFIARRPIIDRGKIGHENDPNLEYVFHLKPTFAYTPFVYWNESAHFKWNSAPHSYAIQGDTNDSFIPLFDLSNTKFIEAFSMLIGVDIKTRIDSAQVTYLEKLTNTDKSTYTTDDLKYLSFLKKYWYPYASDVSRKIFEKVTSNVSLNYYTDTFFEADKNLERIRVPLTPQTFVQNILYAL